tara:strand:+ start:520 stop:792 length:273 start_codon:yes stop_codon:yes gene_type:complete
MANMDYLQRNADNSLADPALGFTVVNNRFSGNEGWTTIPSYKDFNADYVARNPDNSARTPGTFQARNTDNTTRTPAAYQRHGVTNSAISA